MSIPVGSKEGGNGLGSALEVSAQTLYARGQFTELRVNKLRRLEGNY